VKTYTKEELAEVLRLHSLWLSGEKEGIRANLGSANLRSANLRSADLGSAKFSDKTKWPSPTMLLLAWWGQVSDGLCRDLMRFDSACHPDPRAFGRWAKGGACPYDDCNFDRAANFQEQRHLWDSKSRLKRPITLVMRLLEECCEKVDVEE